MKSPEIKEGNLWSWLKGAEKAFKSDLHMTRIENGVGSGTPDVEVGVSIQGGFQTFWLELKTLPIPALKDWDKPFNHEVAPDQRSWLWQRSKTGGKAFVLMRLGSGPAGRRLLIPAGKILRLQEPISFKQLLDLGIDVSKLNPQELIYAISKIQ